MDIRFATIDDIELIIKLRTLQLEDEAKQYNSSETVNDDYLKHMYRYLLINLIKSVLFKCLLRR